MAKYYLQEMPDMRGEGKRKVYPKMQVYRQIEMEELVERIQERSGVYKSGVVKGILTTLSDTLADYLSMGYNVQIKGLGNFSLSLEFTDNKSTKLDNDDDKMNYRHVSVKDINLQSDKELVKRLRNETTLERTMSGVNKLEPETYPREERLRRALKHIDRHGFITLSGYSSLNRISRTSASRELKSLCQDPKSGITSSGVATHKTWVRRKAHE